MATSPSNFPVYTATYPPAAPYPPPASAYTPSSGFSPNWPPPAPEPPPFTPPAFPPTAAYPPPASGFSPAPPFGYSSFPSTDTSSTSASAYAPFTDFSPPPYGPYPPSPWPPPPGAPAPDSSQAAAYSVSTTNPTPATPQHHASTPTSITRETSSIFPSVATYHYTPESVAPPTPEPATSGAPATPAMTVPDSTSAAQAQAKEEAEIGSRLPREVLNIHRRLDHQQLAVDTLQGNISKLTDMVKQIALAVNSSPAPATSPMLASSRHDHRLPDCFNRAPEVTSSSPTTMPGSTTMCTTSSRFSSGPSMSISTVPAAPMYVAPQVLDEMPQSYGFDNLRRQSVFLADGTEHSFYALPENYPLERATPGPVFDACADETDGRSTEIVDVLADLPEQHTHEQEQHKSAQPTNCSKANNTPNLESMLVNNLQVPTSMQDPSSVFKEMPVYDIYEDDNSFLNCMDEQLATPFHKASENALSTQLLTCFSKAPETEQTSAGLNIVTDVFDFTLELQQQDDQKTSNCLVIKASDSVFTRHSQLSIEHSKRESRLLWDPGASAFLVNPLNNGSNSDTSGNEYVGQLISSMGDFSFHAKPPERYGSADSSRPGILLKVLNDENPSTHTHFNLLSCNTQHSLDLSIKKGSIFSAGRTLPWNPWYAILLLHHCLWEFSISSIKHVQWDPGVKVSLYNWLDILTVWSETDKPFCCTHIPDLTAWQNQSVGNSAYPEMVQVLPMKCSARRASIFPNYFPSCAIKSVQVPKQQHPIEFILMAEKLQNVREFRDGQLTYMAQSPAPNFSELRRPMVTALSGWLPSFENKAKLQWDPGIALPCYIYSWLEICRAGQKTAVTFSFVLLFHCHQDPKLAGTALWLITFNPP